MAVASAIEGTIARDVSGLKPGFERGLVTVEHPSGTISADLELETLGDQIRVAKAGFLRSANRLFEGHVFVVEETETV